MKRSSFIVLAAVIGILLTAGQWISAAHTYAASGSDRFRTSAPNPFAGEKDGLTSPADFETAAAQSPTPNGVLFSQCRFAPFTNTNLYTPFAGTLTSDAVVNDTTYAYADGSTCYNPQNESNVVVNPTNSNDVATSANEYRFDGDSVYYSTDGGATFKDVTLPGWTKSTGGSGNFAHMSSCGDPVLAYDPDGKTLYFAGLVCSFQGSSAQSGLAVASSKDNGAIWSAPSLVTVVDPQKYFTDKEWITVGKDHTVYVTWTAFVAPSNTNGDGYLASPIKLAVSRDGGSTWTAPLPVSDSSRPYNQGSQVLTSPDGKTLYVAYEATSPSQGYTTDATAVAVSTDGGNTFTNREVGRVYDDLNCYPFQVGAQGRQTLSGENFRLDSFPSMAVDPTTGKLSIVWADDQANSSCGGSATTFSGTTSNQVKLVTSADGIRFSSPATVTSASADKVFPAVGANNGRTVIGYYTRSYDAKTKNCQAATLSGTSTVTTYGGPVCLDYASLSSDDGFTKETRLTTQSSNPYLQFAGSFIGDYTGLVVDGRGHAWAAYADDRGNPGITAPNQDMLVSRGF